MESGPSIAAAARDVGMAEQTLFHGIRAQRQGRLSGISSSRAPSAEQREIRRLRAEPVRVTRERDIWGKATAYERWYEEFVPKADKNYDQHLRELNREELLSG